MVTYLKEKDGMSNLQEKKSITFLVKGSSKIDLEKDQKNNLQVRSFFVLEFLIFIKFFIIIL